MNFKACCWRLLQRRDQKWQHSQLAYYVCKVNLGRNIAAFVSHPPKVLFPPRSPSIPGWRHNLQEWWYTSMGVFVPSQFRLLEIIQLNTHARARTHTNTQTHTHTVNYFIWQLLSLHYSNRFVQMRTQNFSWGDRVEGLALRLYIIYVWF
jgi:hypothetical protein